jgi:hypothetical protein
VILLPITVSASGKKKFKVSKRFDQRHQRIAKAGGLALHNVVPVGNQTQRDSGRQDGELPDRNRGLGLSCGTGAPSRVDDSPRSDTVRRGWREDETLGESFG